MPCWSLDERRYLVLCLQRALQEAGRSVLLARSRRTGEYWRPARRCFYDFLVAAVFGTSIIGRCQAPSRAVRQKASYPSNRTSSWLRELGDEPLRVQRRLGVRSSSSVRNYVEALKTAGVARRYSRTSLKIRLRGLLPKGYQTSRTMNVCTSEERSRPGALSISILDVAAGSAETLVGVPGVRLGQHGSIKVRQTEIMGRLRSLSDAQSN